MAVPCVVSGSIGQTTKKTVKARFERQEMRSYIISDVALLQETLLLSWGGKLASLPKHVAGNKKESPYSHPRPLHKWLSLVKTTAVRGFEHIRTIQPIHSLELTWLRGWHGPEFGRP